MSSEKKAIKEAGAPVAVVISHAPCTSPEVIKPTQGCCTKKVVIIVLTTVFLLLVALGIAVFFLYPRKITPKVIGFDKNSLKLEVHSDNYIDITINNLDAEVIYNPHIVANLHKSNFKIKGKDTTIVEIPVSNLRIPDAAIDRCIHGSELPLRIYVTVEPRLLSWAGKKFKFTVDQSVSCTAISGNKISAEQLELARRYPTIAKRYIKDRL